MQSDSERELLNHRILTEIKAGDLATAGTIVKGRVTAVSFPKQLTDIQQPRAYLLITEGPAQGIVAVLYAKHCPGLLKADREAYLASLLGQTIEAEVARLTHLGDDDGTFQIMVSLNSDWLRKREKIYKSLTPCVDDTPGTQVIATVKEKHPSGVFCTFPFDGEEVGGYLHFTEMAFRDLTRKSMLAAYKIGDVIACEVLAKKREKGRPLFDVKLTLLASANRKRRAALRQQNFDPDQIFTNCRIVASTETLFKVLVQSDSHSFEGKLKRRKNDPTTLFVGQTVDLKVHMIEKDGSILLSTRGLDSKKAA